MSQKQNCYLDLSKGITICLILVILSACTADKLESTEESSAPSSLRDNLDKEIETPMQPSPSADFSKPTESGVVNISETETPTMHIVCALSQAVVPSESNVFDKIIPGQSTQADVLEILGDPTDEHIWREDTIWYYKMYYSGVTFRDGVVLKRSDLRTQLEEIVATFGIPEQVIWKIPKTDYHDSSSFTYLLYPSHGAIFAIEEQISVFEPDLFFENTTVTTSEYFSFLLKNEIFNEEYDFAIEIEWPCSK